MKKVYVIRYEELNCNGGYYSGISYVFDTLEKAKNMLEIIKEDETQYYFDCGREELENILKTTENSIMFDFLDEYTKYEIVEMEVK